MAKNHYLKPISKALDQYVDQKVIPFHTPGHKQGRGMDSQLLSIYSKQLLMKDLTEVNGLDNLHQPEGCIREAQERVADLLGAQESWLIVAGRIAAVYAALAAVLSPGDAFFADRRLGPDVWRASKLGGFIPVFLPGESIYRKSIFSSTSCADLQAALDQYPAGKAVFLQATTETGLDCDIQAVKKFCEENNLILITDDSVAPLTKIFHGSNRSDKKILADISIQTDFHFDGFPAQGGFLHRGTSSVSSERIQEALQIIQSTSPSYVIMSALDDFRYELWQCGPAKVMDAIQIRKYIEFRYKNAGERTGKFIDEIQNSLGVDPIIATICFPGQVISPADPSPHLRYSGSYVIYCPELKRSRVHPDDILNELLSLQIIPQKESASKAVLGVHSMNPKDLEAETVFQVPAAKAAGMRLAQVYKLENTAGEYLFPGERLSPEWLNSLYSHSQHPDTKIRVLAEV